jgi:hypothetical protein
LGALVEKLLGKPLEGRVEVDCDVMKMAYANSKDLLRVVGLSLQDAADMLQVKLSFLQVERITKILRLQNKYLP